VTPVARSWLYVPGHRADRVAKALASAADAVVVDLEDAVPPDLKDVARATVRNVAAGIDAAGTGRLWVRVNDPAGPWGNDDLDAVAGLPLAGLRLPRSQDPQVVREVAERARLPLQLLVETAAGLARAVELAAAHPLVAGIGLGEADLGADLRISGDAGLEWARGYVVVAARAAGLPSPVQSVYTDVADLDGLRASSRRGREMGFVGRSVVHPRQIPVVHEVFTPTTDELEAARAVVRTAEEARSRGEVAVLDADGRFVDPAVVERARVVLDLAPTSTPQEEHDDH
jgi:citrate lyase subunit beta / citryl-CoA lyase